MKVLDYIRVVLIEPSHPGNIGGVARAMGNMGMTDLALINPAEFTGDVAMARASGADWILHRATQYASLDDAIAECVQVYGLTARPRSVAWPSLAPWEAAGKALAHTRSGQPVAFVFGRERSGLTNRELDRCNALIRIPVNHAMPSLNLAAAVMVMLYELRRSLLATGFIADDDRCPDNPRQFPASAAQLHGYYAHLQRVLQLIDFTDGRSATLMRKMIRLFSRSDLSSEEINILRGILTAVEKSIPNGSGKRALSTSNRHA